MDLWTRISHTGLQSHWIKSNYSYNKLLCFTLHFVILNTKIVKDGFNHHLHCILSFRDTPVVNRYACLLIQLNFDYVVWWFRHGGWSNAYRNSFSLFTVRSVICIRRPAVFDRFRPSGSNATRIQPSRQT